MRDEWKRIRSSALTKNATWLLIGQGTSLLCQALYFGVIARLLHATEYGVYVGALATVSIASQYSPLGSHSVLLRYVSTNKHLYAEYWGNVLATTLSVGTLLVVGFVLVGPHIASSYSRELFFYVAASECICVQITLATARVFQAFEKMRFTALLNSATSALRAALAMALLWQLHHGNAVEWSRAAFVVSLVSCVASLCLVTGLHGFPSFAPNLLRSRTGEGFIFALSYSTSGIANDVDKAMLGHFGMNTANGIYTLAYRVVDSATMPVTAVQAAVFPRIFRVGQNGLGETTSFSCKVLKRTVPVSCICALGVALAAPVIPRVLGPSFAEISEALRWLCLLPVIRSVQLSGGDALTGAGHQPFRLLAQSTAAAFNFVINLFLIPRFSWHGAAWASLATDGLLAIGNWWAVYVLLRRRAKMREPHTQHGEV